VQQGRRSDYLLAGLSLVALANGLLLGLSLYGLFVVLVKLVHGQPPPLAYGWIAGAAAGVALLALALQRERVLRQPALELPDPAPGEAEAAPWWVGRFHHLAAASSLSYVPSLWWIEAVEPNAYAVGRNRDDASVVITTGLLDLLEPEELDAVLGQQIAHVEAEDLKAVGRADAVADSIDDLAQAKGRFFWGPKAILVDMQPFILVSLAGFVLVGAMHDSSENAGVTLLLALLGFAWMVALWHAAKRSWKGLVQLFLFTSFYGPMSLVEWALAPPTAFLLSRLVARARVHEADARCVQILGDRQPLVSALRKLEFIERSNPREELPGRRFSLFVCARPQRGYQAWLARLYSTHPSIASRIATIEADV
jgi:Zn-dependent protease with chaperone function